MARHESDMHRRLRHAQDEIKRLHKIIRDLVNEYPTRNDAVAEAFKLGQFEIGAALRDKREGRS